MKKLIITLEYPPQIGGIATYLNEFTSALISEEVVVLAPRQRGDEEFDTATKFKVIRKKLLFPKFIWPRWLKLFFIVWRIVKKEKIEIIYLHHALPVGYIAWLMKKLFKIPYLIFSHGTDVELGTKNLWKKNLLHLIAQNSERIIFNSHSLKNRLLRIFPELENKASVLYPCPGQIFFSEPNKETIQKLRAQYALEGKKVILTISRLAEGKGLTHLIRILPKILQEIPNLVWLVIGDGSKKDYLWQEIQKNNLQNIVRFLGNIPHNELTNFYHLADLFVLLTHPDEGREEGLGLVFLEAQATGLPVIAGRSGGVEEGVLHAQTGIIVDIYKGDKPMIDSIVEMLKNKSFALQLAQNARERMKKEFVWKKQLQIISRWL